MDLRLSAPQLEGMYRNVLVDLGAPVVEAGVAKERLKFLGNNLRNVTVLVESPDAVFLEESSLQFLTKILGACKLNLGDIALINVATARVTIDEVQRELAPAQTILLGVEPEAISLAFNFPEFKIQSHGNCQYLKAPSISVLNGQTEEAKQLKANCGYA